MFPFRQYVSPTGYWGGFDQCTLPAAHPQMAWRWGTMRARRLANDFAHDFARSRYYHKLHGLRHNQHYPSALQFPLGFNRIGAAQPHVNPGYRHMQGVRAGGWENPAARAARGQQPVPAPRWQAPYQQPPQPPQVGAQWPSPAHLPTTWFAVWARSPQQPQWQLVALTRDYQAADMLSTHYGELAPGYDSALTAYDPFSGQPITD